MPTARLTKVSLSHSGLRGGDPRGIAALLCSGLCPDQQLQAAVCMLRAEFRLPRAQGPKDAQAQQKEAFTPGPASACAKRKVTSLAGA